MEMIGRFSTTVIHDLNNLLTVIQLNAAMLEIGGLEEGESVKLVDEINKACSCASDLTRSVLSFSSRRENQPGQFELGKAMSDLAPLLNALIGRKTTLVKNLSKESIRIKGTPVEFQQILLNLIDNAIDSDPASGMTLTMRSVVSEKDGRKMAEITVSDTGRGIAKENLPRIFDAFFSTKAQSDGTGLGLHIVRRIVRQWGGSLEVESDPGKGTSFRVLLPQVDEEAEIRQDEAAPDRDGTLQATVLVVEDDAAIRDIGRQILERRGAKVLEAADAEEARKIWKLHRDDIRLLFTDIVLPGDVSGDRLARDLLGEKDDLKILYTSGNIAASQRVPELNDANFLLKPYRPEVLVQAAIRILG